MATSPAPRALIFDVDGTLAETERDGHRVAFNLAFERLGLPDRWDEEVYGELLSTPGGKQRLDRHLAGRGMPADERARLVPELHRLKNEEFLSLIRRGGIEPRRGILRLIDEAFAAGVRVGIATTGSRAWVDELLEVLLGRPRRDRLGAIVTAEDAAYKPDPEIYLVALARLREEPRNAVAIEDSALGLQAAKAAGLYCAVVRSDYTADQDFARADLVVDDLGDEGKPARIVCDPHHVVASGLVDLVTLGRLVAAR